MVKTKKGYLDLSPRFFWLVNSVSPRAAQPSPDFFSLEWLIWGWCFCCFLSFLSLFLSGKADLSLMKTYADCCHCCWCCCCCFLSFFLSFYPSFSLWKDWSKVDANLCRLLSLLLMFLLYSLFFSLWAGWSKVDANLCRLLSGGAEKLWIVPRPHSSFSDRSKIIDIWVIRSGLTTELAWWKWRQW